MTLSSRHRIRSLSPGGLRPSTLPLGHGGSPQYWVLVIRRRRRRCQRSSIRPWIERIQQFGVYDQLMVELRNEDQAFLKNFLRIPPDMLKMFWNNSNCTIIMKQCFKIIHAIAITRCVFMCYARAGIHWWSLAIKTYYIMCVLHSPNTLL